MGGIVDIFTGGNSRVEPAAVNVAPGSVFENITTPGLNFTRTRGEGFNLARSSDSFNQLGSSIGQLSGIRSGIGGLIPGIQGLDPDLIRLQQLGSGLFDTNAMLQSQLGQTLPQAGGLFNAAGGVGRRFGELGGELAGVSDSIRPGFGRLTDSLVNQVRNERAAASGNLRENFAQRNLAGSSFATQEQRRLETDFSQREEAARAQAFQQEMAATAQIAQVRGQVLTGELGSIDEQRAVLEETRQIINSAGNLLALDQQNIQQQASLVGMRLGLNQAEAANYAQQMANIQLEMNGRLSQIQTELSELGLAGNIQNGVMAQAMQLGMAEANLITEAAAQTSYNRLFQGTQQLGFIGNVASLGIQGFDAGLFGGGGGGIGDAFNTASS